MAACAAASAFPQWWMLLMAILAILSNQGSLMGMERFTKRHRKALNELLDKGIEPTNNAADRALRQSVIQRKISHGVQSARGANCCSRLLTVTTTLRQQGRDVWEFLEQAWIAHHCGGVMPSLLPDPGVQQ